MGMGWLVLLFLGLASRTGTGVKSMNVTYRGWDITYEKGGGPAPWGFTGTKGTGFITDGPFETRRITRKAMRELVDRLESGG